MDRIVTDRPREMVLSNELRSLVERAEQGDASALPGLHEALDRVPALWGQYADLAAAAERAWVGLAAGDNLMLAESLTRKLASLRAELAGPGEPPPLERLLVARVAAGWLQVHYAEALFAQLKAGG